MKNTYSFLVDNVKLTLLPSPRDRPKPSKGTDPTLFAKQEFIKEMSDSVQVYVLYGKECNSMKEVPEIAKELVEEFFDVFPEELPKELPPLHDIQHQIDTI
jgi:hypothetical protein